MEWADALVWRAVFASDEACGDERLRQTFHHLHLVQHAWLRAWRGDAMDPGFPTIDHAASVRDWGRKYYEEIHAHLETMSDEKLSATMKLPWAEMVERELGRIPESISVGDTMQQVPLHSLYHRGQINARLRVLGGEPPRVDYIVWLWLGRPEAHWHRLQNREQLSEIV